MCAADGVGQPTIERHAGCSGGTGPGRGDAVWHVRAERAGVDVGAREPAHQRGRVLLEASHEEVPRSAPDGFRGCRVEEGDDVGVGEPENLDRLLERPVGLHRDVDRKRTRQTDGSGRIPYAARLCSVDGHLD